MVNELRLSPLSALRKDPPVQARLSLAMVSFGALAALSLLALGLHFMGDPSGGTPQLSVALDLPVAQTAGPGDPIVLAPGDAFADVEVAAVHVLEAGGSGESLPEPETRIRITSSQDQVRLADAPRGGLVEPSEHGPLPIMGASGERASHIYARPFTAPAEVPRVALVIGGLGLNAEATRHAIETLPGEVTLSFVPYAENLQSWVDAARDAGHEVIIEVPLEPFDYPNNNPGPATLLTSSDWTENADRLQWVMGRAVGYVGLMNYQGARLTADEDTYAPILAEIAARGLLYLDDGSSPRSLTGRIGGEIGGEWAVASRRIDQRRNAGAVRNALTALEETAANAGVAIGVGFAYPVTVEEIQAWTRTLEGKGLVLAPLSATSQAEAS